MRPLEWLNRGLNETVGFDYVDRFIVTIFLMISLMTSIFVLSQELSLAEQREVAPAFEMLGHLLYFFVLWPIIRLAIDWGSHRLATYWKQRGESA